MANSVPLPSQSSVNLPAGIEGAFEIDITGAPGGLDVAAILGKAAGAGPASGGDTTLAHERTAVIGTVPSGEGTGVAGFANIGIGVLGQTGADTIGVHGNSVSDGSGGGVGVLGTTTATDVSGVGVKGTNAAGAIGTLGGVDTVFQQHAGVFGESDQQGVFGHSTTDGGTGVYGNSAGAGFGVRGDSNAGVAVQGQSFSTGVGVQGISAQGSGVAGSNAAGAVGRLATTDDVYNQQAGVFGESDQQGVFGKSLVDGGTGVYGFNKATNAIGKLASTDDQFHDHAGVYGSSDQQGVIGYSTAADGTGVFGFAAGGAGFGIRGEANTGVAIQGTAELSGLAGKFIGNVHVTGDISLVNQDVAEDFDVSADLIEPGMVTVLDADGALTASSEPYDRRVAGVAAGAGDLKPGVILGRRDGERSRVPIALLGKAFCNVDARYGPVAIGDLLTTSPTRGHAMKALDPTRAFGAVIGKALRPLQAGQGLIPVLIALQ